MTDEQLKELVANLAISQAKTDEQLKEFVANLTISYEELKKFVTNLAISQAKTDEELNKFVANLAISQAKTDEELNKISIELNKNSVELNKSSIEFNKRIKKLEELVGSIGNNQGDVAEEFFFNSLSKSLKLGNISFDDITENIHKHRGKTQEEYDIVMTNGDVIGIIEVKYKTHINDIDKLKRKIKNYKTLFPRDKDFKLYGAIAGFYIPSSVVSKAKENGFFILKRSGNLIDVDSSEIKSY